jgi:hypothetical protein
MKTTNIKILTEIIREISFEKGHAADDNLEDMADNALSNLDIDEDLDRAFPDDTRYVDLPTNNKTFVKSLAKRTTTIAQSGAYTLLVKNGGKPEFQYFLVNKSAKQIKEFFIASMRTDITTYRRYNLQKAFDVVVETVHWSNLATELRGQGVGKLLYTLVYEHVKGMGRAFGSDYMLFEGSAGMWMTYMSKLGSYFGVVLDGIILPIPKEELTIKNKPIFDMWGLDGFIAMENPPKLVRKIMHNVQDLSYIRGEYGVAKSYANVNDVIEIYPPIKPSQLKPGMKGTKPRKVQFIDYINEFKTIKDLLNSKVENIVDEIDTAKKKKNIKALIFAFADAMVVVKQTQNGLVPVVI